jgi:hypothetical protein
MRSTVYACQLCLLTTLVYRNLTECIAQCEEPCEHHTNYDPQVTQATTMISRRFSNEVRVSAISRANEMPFSSGSGWSDVKQAYA